MEAMEIKQDYNYLSGLQKQVRKLGQYLTLATKANKEIATYFYLWATKAGHKKAQLNNSFSLIKVAPLYVCFLGKFPVLGLNDIFRLTGPSTSALA